MAQRSLGKHLRPALLIFALALFVAGIFAVVLPAKFREDAGTDYKTFYGPVAWSIAHGKGIVLPNGDPATRYPPGYSIVLSLFFRAATLLKITEATAITAMNAIGFAVTVVLIYLAAAHLWGAAHGFVVATLWLTYPLNLFFTVYPSPEIPFEIILYLSLLAFLWTGAFKQKLWFPLSVCGFLVGCAMLVRPIALCLGFVLAICVWLLRADLGVRIRVGLMALLLAANFLTVLPWEAWVYRKTGKVVLLGTLGPSSLKSALTFHAGNKKFRKGVWLPEDVRELTRDIASRADTIQSYSDIAAILKSELKRRPVTVFKLFVVKAARSWYGTDSQRWELPIAIVQAPYLFLVTFALFRAFRIGGASRSLAIMVGFIALYFWGMNILSLTMVRYSVPSMALLFLLVPVLLQPSNESTQIDGGKPQTQHGCEA